MIAILSILLLISELSAAIVQLLYPSNVGVSGILAAAIKILQILGAKNPQI